MPGTEVKAALVSGDRAARFHALVISDNFVATFPLPDAGTVRIGRSPPCEILIDDASVSRAHAEIAMGPPLVLRDLGSANGTQVQDRKLAKDERVEIQPREAVQIGAATLIVQQQPTPVRPRRLWTHDYFEVRLEEECTRAMRHGASFAVMRLSCASRASPTVLQQVVTDLLRLSDVVGEYGPSDFEVLLVDTAPEDVDVAVRRIVGELGKHGIEVRVGTAVYPRDGRNSDELMSHAEASARGIAASDSGPQSGTLVAERTMQDLYTLAARIATGTISVLILGETGVGKELLAEHIHKSSPRAARPYVRLNCGAISESLLESELFGHERGAFTGAVGTKQGLLETADGGSVFLDEVGELPPSIQVKLLRVIEERAVLRVGGLKPRPLDLRFIAATNRDLEAEVARGTFRQDLFFRLNGATLVIPPLRERANEIPALAKAFLAHAARQAGMTRVPALGADVLERLLRYSWPGNIRELRNVIERAVLLCGDGDIGLQHVPLEKMRVTLSTPAQPRSQLGSPRDAQPEAMGLLRRGRRLSEEEERTLIKNALEACGGNQTRAARMLGIGRRTLINRVREFGLARPRGKYE